MPSWAQPAAPPSAAAAAPASAASAAPAPAASADTHADDAKYAKLIKTMREAVRVESKAQNTAGTVTRAGGEEVGTERATYSKSCKSGKHME